MKKYILSAVIIMSLASCNLPQGGNKNRVKITDEVQRYSDDMIPAQKEPQFGPHSVTTPAPSIDSSQSAHSKTVNDSAQAVTGQVEAQK
ncbi:hypothetical protein GNY06_06365 [Elizabethkingia argentiflava]|uniref:Lipoprotein n=1 Tax=Elizabethkingia argenteiflava TaxID=2681556 RepID=A0A845PXE4_9FLAO|nr:hypothetical protein [Elizabethkingia argenteiflava]NAW51008.1 hypothetical protein [Elizabethkingia argenteiflava]